MTRVVLDTNVLAPGFASRAGASNHLITLWQEGEYVLVVSEHILTELVRTFQDPYYRARVSPQQAERALLVLRAEANLTPLTVPVIGVATQPKDDLVLSTALSGQASILCTRDKQLLKLQSYQTVAILSPGEFLARLESEGLA